MDGFPAVFLRAGTEKYADSISFFFQITDERHGVGAVSYTHLRMLMDCGKRVESEARAYMEEVIGSWETISRPFLQTECDKIVLMAGNRTGISKKLLEYALPEYMDQGIFKFTDALIAKNASAVMENTDHVFTDVSETIKNLGFISAKFKMCIRDSAAGFALYGLIEYLYLPIISLLFSL